MAENSNIEWTTHTFNPWTGCSKVSPGCENCYAENLMDKRYHKAKWGPSGTRIVASENYWRQPFKWDNAAAKAGQRHRVFCASLADIFEDWQEPMLDSTGHVLKISADGEFYSNTLLIGKDVATMSDIRGRLYKTINATPNLDWLLLTKRPENFRRMLPDRWFVQHLHNVWLGVSVEDQRRADKRIPHLLKTPAAVRFLSCEPLLSGLTLWPWLCDPKDYGFYKGENGKTHVAGAAEFKPGSSPLNWVIVGGESGHGARPMQIEWARSIVQQCRKAGVACFVKQLGADPKFHRDESTLYIRDRKGGDPAEWPEDLRVRQFPATDTHP